MPRQDRAHPKRRQRDRERDNHAARAFRHERREKLIKQQEQERRQ